VQDLRATNNSRQARGETSVHGRTPKALPWDIILRAFGAGKQGMIGANKQNSIYFYYFKPIISDFLCNIFLESQE
jgi:hypothetical protein